MLDRKIDFNKEYIAGLLQKSIGIYKSREKVFVVEVQKRIRKIVEKKSKVYVIKRNGFSAIIPQIIKDFNVNETLINFNLNAPGAFFKIIKIPQMPEKEISFWLEENLERLLKISISVHNKLISYKILKKEDEIVLLIGLVEKEEIAEILTLLKDKNKYVYSFAPGRSDIYILEQDKISDRNSVYFIEEGFHEFLIYNKNDLIYYNQIPPAIHKNEQNIEKLFPLLERMFSGDFDQISYTVNRNSIEWIRDDDALGFKAANALAQKPYYPRKNTFRFLPAENKSLNSEFIWKQVFLKTTLLLGGFIFFLYFISFALTLLFTNINNTAVSQLEALNVKIIQIDKLRHSGKLLKRDLDEATRIKSYRSHSSLILDIIAAHIPEGCWLTEINYDKKVSKRLNTFIRGMSASGMIINQFLRNMENDESLSSVNLDYINKIPGDKMFRNWKIKSGKYYEFRISFDY